MKKLILMLVAIATITFSACTNTTSQPTAADSDSTAVVIDSIIVDSAETIAIDTLINE